MIHGTAPSSRRGTVLIAHPSPDLYGSDRMLVETVAGLVTAGWRTVVTLPESGPLVPALVEFGATVEICRTPVLRKSALRPRGFVELCGLTVRSLLPARRLWHRYRADVLLVNTVTIPTWIVLGRLWRRPVIVHVHEAEVGAPRLVRALLALPQSAASIIVVNSRATGAVLESALPFLRRRVRLVYNGVAGPPRPTPAREALTGAVRLLFVGRLSPRKGPDLAIEATGLLRDSGHAVTLDIVGSAYAGYEWFEQDLRESAARRGLADSVRFGGFSDPVWRAYEDADIVVCPSRDSEPFGNVSVEAQLARRPVVVTDVQGLVETVGDGRRGEIAAPDDAVALAEAVGRLLDDWPGATSRSERARGECLRLFGQERYRHDIVALVEEVAGGRSSDAGRPGRPARLSRHRGRSRPH